MRKPVTMVLVLLLAAGLAGCGGGDMPASEASSESIPAPSSSVSGAVSSLPEASSQSAEAPPPEADGFVNSALLAVIGQPLAVLEADYCRDYFIYHIGEFTAALEYYDPYACFYFDPVGYFNLSGKPENQWDEDPFVHDSLLIKWIGLQAEVDPASGQVADQASLRRLFATDEAITYALLCERLGQAPALEHNPEGGYTKVVEQDLGGEYTPLEGGTYSAEFEIEGRPVAVGFIKTGEDHMAHSVWVDSDVMYMGP